MLWLQNRRRTAFVDNEVGHLIEDFIMQGGVDTDFILWRPDDGIGRSIRNGLNFTERGFGIRGAVGVSDRGNSAAAQLKPGDFDWDHIFGKIGARWLHTGGIFAALSETTAALTIEAVKAAKKHGVIVSYDLNYRPSLWKSIGGLKKAQEVNREIAKYVDVMIGNEEDFTASLGFEVKGADHSLSKIETDAFKAMIETAVKAFRISKWPRRRCAASSPRRRTTGAPFSGTTANFSRAGNIPNWKFWTASAAATVLPAACNSVSSNSTTRKRRWNTARRTARWLRRRPATRAWPRARKWKRRSWAAAARGCSGNFRRKK
jgi:hypothetical protein